jgi:hypothetical protein
MGELDGKVAVITGVPLLGPSELHHRRRHPGRRRDDRDPGLTWASGSCRPQVTP